MTTLASTTSSNYRPAPHIKHFNSKRESSNVESQPNLNSLASNGGFNDSQTRNNQISRFGWNNK